MLIAILVATLAPRINAENGYRLWLRYEPLETTQQNALKERIRQVVIPEQSSVMQSAAAELTKALPAMLQTPIQRAQSLNAPGIVVITATHPYAKQLGLRQDMSTLGEEGYLLRTVKHQNKMMVVVAGKNDAGALYGTYALLRLLQTGNDLTNLNVREAPSFAHRLLNHWDNLNGTVERGYAGHSIWWNVNLNADSIIARHEDYARANASIGINGTVLNNVNATPQMLTSEYLEKVAVIAGRLRPYHIKVYLSINFSSPKELGGIENSDPLNPQVAQWWKEKAIEIYRLIPDFGGFLVKANSEGLPGPQDYGRTHADGANMLADALKPHGGLVMWRAFVYNPTPEDRAKQAYSEFKPLDGQFRDNVIVQVKNGPIDFQPREPFSPMFGAMEKTPLMMEFQITQEYLGHSNHLVYLAPMYKEVLDADTHCKGTGSTVAKTLDGSIYPHQHTAIAGVSNIGRDANWCGHDMAQSNWYAYGRLAWNHQLTSEQIANEWVRMTFSNQAEVVTPISSMMMASHQTCVDYSMPMGLHHIMGWDHHYGPEPWTEFPGARADWLPKYYHQASASGLGFDRTDKGSNATAQYAEPLRSQLNDATTCPEGYLLWFHHLPWDYPMKSGRTLWHELIERYHVGTNNVRGFQRTWDSMEGQVDAERFKAVQYKLKIQARDAIWWRDACLLYFQTFSKLPIPLEYERPIHDLNELKQIKLDMGHHN